MAACYSRVFAVVAATFAECACSYCSTC